MTYEKETEILLQAAKRLRELGFVVLASVIENIANMELADDETK
jgi:hypothetical protein